MGIGVFVEFAASTAGLTAAFAEINGEMDKMRSKGKSSMEQMSTASKMAAVAVGVGVASVVGESVKMGAEFEKSTNLLVTAAGESTKNLGMVRQGILAIASSTGATWQNLSEGMYDVEKAGYRGAQGLMVLKAAAQGAAEENANLSTVTNAMTSVMASYHLKATDSVQVMNAIKTAAGESKTTMEMFSGSLSTVIPIASANKISFAEVAGAIATLTQHGTSADEATQELSNTIRNLAAPNRVAQNEMQQLGLDVQDVSTGLGKRGLSGTIDLLVGAITTKMGPSGKVMLDAFNQSKTAAADANAMISKMPDSLAKLAKEYQAGTITTADWTGALKAMSPEQANLAKQFATVQNRASGFNSLMRSGDPAAQTFTDALKKATGGATGLNTVLMLSGENTAGYQKRIEAVAKSMNDKTKDVEGWASTQKLAAQRVAEARQSVDALGIQLGMALLPALEAVMSAVAEAAQWFVKHKTTAEALAITIGTVLTAVMVAYTAMLAKSAAETVTSYGRMVAAALGWNAETDASFAAWALSQAKTFAASAAAGAVWLAEHAVMAAAYIASNVAMAAAAVAAFIAENAATLGIAAGIALLVTGIIYLATHWSQSWAAIKTAASVASAWVVTHVKDIWDQFVSFEAWLGGLEVRFGQLLISAGQALIHGLIQGIQSQISAVKSTLTNLTSAITSWKGPPEKDATLLTGAGQLIIGGLIDGLESQYGSVKASLAAFTAGLGADVSSSAGTLALAASGTVSQAISVSSSGGAASTDAASAHYSAMASDASTRAAQHDETNDRLAALEAALARLPQQTAGALKPLMRTG